MRRIEATDCKRAEEQVKKTLESLFHHANSRFRKVFKTDCYSIGGSVKCKVKVGRPDEFDVLLPLNIDPDDIELSRTGTYMATKDCDCENYYEAGSGSESDTMCVGKHCSYKTRKTKISKDDFGMHIVKIDESSPAIEFLEKYYILHDRTDLSPRLVMAFLVRELNKACDRFNDEEEEDDVEIMDTFNGPAINLKIDLPSFPFRISVDIVPSMKFPMSYLSHRQEKVIKERLHDLPRSARNTIQDEDLCLVPKFEHAWKMSFANFENRILNSFYDGDDSDDEDFDCKKYCLRYAKYRLEKWKKRSETGLNSMSSYLMKSALLHVWEDKPKDKYWSEDCYEERYLDMLEELDSSLSIGEMEEFFNDSVNLLERKPRKEVSEMRKIVNKERKRMSKKI